MNYKFINHKHVGVILILDHVILKLTSDQFKAVVEQVKNSFDSSIGT